MLSVFGGYNFRHCEERSDEVIFVKRRLPHSLFSPAMILPLLAVVLFLSGCAYKYDTIFAISNASEQTITVRVSDSKSHNGISEYTLEKGRQQIIFRESNKCPENYTPQDNFTDHDIIPPANRTAVLEILVDGKKLSDDIRLRAIWAYFSTDYMERYTLPITDEVISYYLEESR